MVKYLIGHSKNRLSILRKARKKNNKTFHAFFKSRVIVGTVIQIIISTYIVLQGIATNQETKIIVITN